MGPQQQVAPSRSAAACDRDAAIRIVRRNVPEILILPGDFKDFASVRSAAERLRDLLP